MKSIAMWPLVLGLTWASPIQTTEKETNLEQSEAAEESAVGKAIQVVFHDGQELVGLLVSETNSTIVIEMSNGSLITLEKDKLKSIQKNPSFVQNKTGGFWTPDPAESRYLYAASGFMLPKGQWSFSQKELFFSTVHYGLTDYASIQVGSILPAFFNSYPNGIFALKLGTSLNDWISIAGGSQAFWGEDDLVFIPFGVLTLGQPGQHISLNMGYPVANNEGQKLLINVSGKKRISKHSALVAEVWTVEGEWLWAPAIRLMGKNFSTDLGMVLIPDIDIPIPWIDFSYSW